MWTSCVIASFDQYSQKKPKLVSINYEGNSFWKIFEKNHKKNLTQHAEYDQSTLLDGMLNNQDMTGINNVFALIMQSLLEVSHRFVHRLR